ncbi:MAG TPA: type II toxin-antitoxin system RelE/ParE family toxin [Chloroflexota bacterium]|nr:type II toxin-antitoxin system RelE/ParE family toxin [Chloroflexota bacterium]
MAYVAQDNPDAAYVLLEDLQKRVGRLATFPRSGRPGRIPGTRELVVARYIVANRVGPDAVTILRILHGAQQWPVARLTDGNPAPSFRGGRGAARAG